MTIYCIGRNYAEHAKELGNAVPSSPVVFLKPTSSLVEVHGRDRKLELDKDIGRIDYEAEIVLRLGASSSVSAVAVGIDFTARDIQDELKKKSLPWARAKGRRAFAPVSEWVDWKSLSAGGGKLEDLALELKVDGEVRQSGSASQMIFPIPALLEFLSREFALEEGDLVFTGTPSGVGPVSRGNRLEAQLLLGTRRLTDLLFTVG